MVAPSFLVNYISREELWGLVERHPWRVEDTQHLKGKEEGFIIVSECSKRWRPGASRQELARTNSTFFWLSWLFPDRSSRRGWVILGTCLGTGVWSLQFWPVRIIMCKTDIHLTGYPSVASNCLVLKWPSFHREDHLLLHMASWFVSLTQKLSGSGGNDGEGLSRTWSDWHAYQITKVCLQP